jgi:hypothetical protein
VWAWVWVWVWNGKWVWAWVRVCVLPKRPLRGRRLLDLA